MAAAAVLLVVSGVLYLRHPAPGLPTTIDAGRELPRSSSVALSAPIGDVVEAPRRLQWEPVAGRRVRYHVRLMEIDRHELWTSDATATSVEVPAAVRAAIVPAKTLLWQVSALDASGVRLADSVSSGQSRANGATR